MCPRRALLNNRLPFRDRTQQQRYEAWRELRRGDYDIMVATDVASRGLDIKGVDLVVNFDLPSPDEPHTYVHRIGRAGRAGNPGDARSFFDSENQNDRALAPYIVKVCLSRHYFVAIFPNWPISTASIAQVLTNAKFQQLQANNHAVPEFLRRHALFE